MAKSNFNKGGKKQDGRVLFAQTLVNMDKTRVGFSVKTHESRAILHAALNDFGGLSANEKTRFVSAMNEYISSVMQGSVLLPDAFFRANARQLEGVSARINKPLAQLH